MSTFVYLDSISISGLVFPYVCDKGYYELLLYCYYYYHGGGVDRLAKLRAD